MSLGFTFALLLTLQSLQVSTSSPPTRIPDDWKRNNGLNSPEEDLGGSSVSMTFSGDDEFNAGNQTVIAVIGQYNANTNTTLSPQSKLSVNSDPTIINATYIQQNITSNPITPNAHLDPSTAISSDVNLTETNTTHSSPEILTNTSTTTIHANTTTTSSAVGFNFTQNSTTSGIFMSTSPPQLANYTESPSENSTNMTIVTTTTMLNQTSVVLLNESSTAFTTNINETEGSLSSRGNIDRGEMMKNVSLLYPCTFLFP